MDVNTDVFVQFEFVANKAAQHASSPVENARSYKSTASQNGMELL